MDFKNCSMCKKLFLANEKSICPDCTVKENENFDKVKAYLFKNPTHKIDVVSKNTNVSIRKITNYIKENRLMAIGALSDDIVCDICGIKITRGKFCKRCSRDISNKADVMKEELIEEKVKGPKVHIRTKPEKKK